MYTIAQTYHSNIHIYKAHIQSHTFTNTLCLDTAVALPTRNFQDIWTQARDCSPEKQTKKLHICNTCSFETGISSISNR